FRPFWPRLPEISQRKYLKLGVSNYHYCPKDVQKKVDNYNRQIQGRFGDAESALFFLIAIHSSSNDDRDLISTDRDRPVEDTSLATLKKAHCVDAAEPWRGVLRARLSYHNFITPAGWLETAIFTRVMKGGLEESLLEA
ncbi:MAG: hypothetical protein V7703_17480, partial [Hyphomicrobiales bacterium]